MSHSVTPWTAACQASHCSSLFPWVYSNLCPLSHWCHPNMLFSVTLFSSCLQSFPALKYFLMSPLFRWSGQSIEALTSASILPMNIQGRFLRIKWFDLLAVQGTLKSFLQHHNLKTSILWWSALFTVQLSHLYMTTGKTITLTIWNSVSKVMSLLFNMLSLFLIDFLPRIKHLLITWLQSSSTVILDPKKVKSFTVSKFFPINFPWIDWTGCHDLSFLNVEL